MRLCLCDIPICKNMFNAANGFYLFVARTKEQTNHCSLLCLERRIMFLKKQGFKNKKEVSE